MKMSTSNKSAFSNGQFPKSKTRSNNNKRYNDHVPPLIQFPTQKKDSPISSLKQSLVRSQYLYEQGEKHNQRYQTQAKYKKSNQNYFYEVHYENPSINGHINSEIASKNYQDRIHERFDQKASKQLHWMLSSGRPLQTDPILTHKNKASKFDQKSLNRQIEYRKNDNQKAITQQSQHKQASEKIQAETESLKLYNEIIQLYNRSVCLERSQAELYWLHEKPSTQLLSSLMASKQRLQFFLKYLQNTIVKKKTQKYQQDMEILNCLLIKILTQKKQNAAYVQPQMYVSSDGIKIDFDPQHQSKLKEQKISELRQKIYQKNKQIQFVTSQYCIIAQNYAQAIFNIGKMNSSSEMNQSLRLSEAAQIMMMSFRKSNQSNPVRDRNSLA